MRQVQIACLVEGDGEVEAVPVLIRRIVLASDPLVTPEVARPFRHPSGSIRKVDGLERALNAVAELHRDHAILVLIDSDDDCPHDLGPQLAARAKEARKDLHIAVVLAHREYESWFIAAAESLAGKRRLDLSLAAPDNYEQIRDAKGWLSERIVGPGRCSPTQDQAALTMSMDLQLVRNRSRSFHKLWKELERIVEAYAYQ